MVTPGSSGSGRLANVALDPTHRYILAREDWVGGTVHLRNNQLGQRLQLDVYRLSRDPHVVQYGRTTGDTLIDATIRIDNNREIVIAACDEIAIDTHQLHALDRAATDQACRVRK